MTNDEGESEETREGGEGDWLRFALKEQRADPHGTLPSRGRGTRPTVPRELLHSLFAISRSAVLLTADK